MLIWVRRHSFSPQNIDFFDVFGLFYRRLRVAKVAPVASRVNSRTISRRSSGTRLSRLARFFDDIATGICLKGICLAGIRKAGQRFNEFN